MNNKSERIAYLDIAKGIAIISMVFGHSDLLLENFQTVNSYIYIFHMPIFFLIGGYLFNNSKKFKDFFLNKVKSLVVPYLFLFFLTCIFNGIIKRSYYGFTGRRLKVLAEIAKSFLYGNGIDSLDGSILAVGPIWFIPCFFFANLIFFFLLKMFDKFVRDNIFWQITVVTAVSVLGVVFSKMKFLLPFGIDIALFCQIFMFAGYLIKSFRLIEKKSFNIPLLIVSFIVYIYVSATYQGIGLNDRLFGYNFTPAVGAIFGSIFVLLLSRYLDKLVIIPSVLEFLGRISIIVLCFHISEYHFFSLIKVPFIHSFYDNAYLLTTYRLIFCIIIYVIIAVTPLYRIFFKKRPKGLFLKPLVNRINNVKDSVGRKKGTE